jgi:hypothetical protein
MSMRSGITNEGALYELLARGNKDVFFFKDDFDAISPYDNRYNPVPAQLHELRRIPPLNGADFGRTCEFEFEAAGEVFVDPTLVIDLPSWLPPVYAAANGRSVITDLSGVSYGYTNGIAYFLFSKIQIYQDQLLLQEFSGDALYAASRARGSLSSAFLENKITGVHTGSALDISRAATPGRLRFHLPLLGCQHPDDGGFPSIAARAQTYKLRVTLRRLEDLVEASDSRPKPTPWARTDFISQPAATRFPTLQRSAVGVPTLQLETRHIYVDPDTRERLTRSELEVPFSRLYENVLTYGAKDYEPLSRGAVANGTRRIDATHPAGRLLFWFYKTADLRANKYTKITQDDGTDYYNNVSLIIASRDREPLATSLLWNKLQHLAKEERDPGPGIGTMNWELGDLRGREGPYQHQPEGAINFTTADRPTMYTDLADVPVDSVTGQKSTEMHVVVDSWAIATFEKGRGGLKYAN